MSTNKKINMQNKVSTGTFPLHDAVRSMDLVRVKELVETGADVNAKNNAGRTPLHMFNYEYDLDVQKEMLRFFLDRGASVNISSSWEMTVAIHMICRGKVDLVKMLIQHGVDFLVDTENSGTTLLHHAARNKNPGVIELFQDYNISLNALDNCKRTPLYWAALFKNVYAVDFLLKNGANANGCERTASPLVIGFLANRYKNNWEDWLKCIELLLSHGADCEHTPEIYDWICKSKAFVLAKPLLEHLAMREALGITLKESSISKINYYEKLKNYFDFCKQIIKQMKRTVIYNKITLFAFLEENEKQLAIYARNRDSVAKLQRVLHSKRNSDLSIMKTLRKRITNALETAKLREQSAKIISKLTRLDRNWDVIDVITMYLNNEDLKTVCKV